MGKASSLEGTVGKAVFRYQPRKIHRQRACLYCHRQSHFLHAYLWPACSHVYECTVCQYQRFYSVCARVTNGNHSSSVLGTWLRTRVLFSIPSNHPNDRVGIFVPRRPSSSLIRQYSHFSASGWPVLLAGGLSIQPLLSGPRLFPPPFSFVHYTSLKSVLLQMAGQLLATASLFILQFSASSSSGFLIISGPASARLHLSHGLFLITRWSTLCSEWGLSTTYTRFNVIV